jgi:hypothetical protein
MKTLRLLVAATLAAASLSAHAVGRLADLSIYDRSTGRELPVHWHEGRAYVVGRPGNEYQVQVRNRSGEDLLTIMSVDGVNVISGQTASATEGSGYVLSPWENASIRGWRKSMADIAAFYFTSLGDSYAGRTGRPDNVGVIGVALYQRKRVEPPPATYMPEPFRERHDGAANESKKSLGAAAPASPAPAEADGNMRDQAQPRAKAESPLGTGHGRREHAPTRYVDFQRRTAEPVETIAIYYDSYRNLVAQGVISSYSSRRDPNPFPTGFVRDP